jgi:hypothetical protein
MWVSVMAWHVLALICPDAPSGLRGDYRLRGDGLWAARVGGIAHRSLRLDH